MSEYQERIAKVILDFNLKNGIVYEYVPVGVPLDRVTKLAAKFEHALRAAGQTCRHKPADENGCRGCVEAGIEALENE